MQAEIRFKGNSDSSQNTHERKLSFRNATGSQASYRISPREAFLAERTYDGICRAIHVEDAGFTGIIPNTSLSFTLAPFPISSHH